MERERKIGGDERKRGIRMEREAGRGEGRRQEDGRKED